MKIKLVSFLVLLAVSSSAQTVTNKTVSIEPHLSFQNYEHFKRLPLSSPNSPLEYLEGFEFSWGYKYELSVKETKLEQWLSDGTQYQYSFDKVLSKTKVPDSTQFKLFIDPNRYYYEVDSSEQDINLTLKQVNDSTYSYFDEVEIEVPENLRGKFDRIVNGGQGKLGRFIYINDRRIRLIHL